MKKLFALLLALTMIVAMAVPTMAADDAVENVGGVAESYTITINNKTDGHTYEAYQIFSGDLLDEDGKLVLSNVQWGSSITDPNAFLEAIHEENKLSILKGADDAASLAKLLSGVTSDSATLDLFAQVLGGYLGTPAGTSTDKGDTYVITGLPAGYYLVKDKTGSLENAEYDSYTKFILRVVKDQEVSPKSDVPEVEKTISDNLSNGFAEYEDFDITDLAYYKWEGSMPSNLSAYEKYYYEFEDTLPKGIIFEKIQQIYVEDSDSTVVHTFYDVTDSDTENDTLPSGITLTQEGQHVIRQADGSFAHEGDVINENTSGKIALKFDDLFTIYPNIQSGDKIVVKYTALVSRYVIFDAAMENDVIVKYSNDPNDPKSNSYGTTPKDEAYAFTFAINVDKYDADNVNTKLANAKFVLYYTRVEGEDKVNHYAQVVTEEMIDANQQINGVLLTYDYLGNVYGWTTDREAASILDTDAEGKLRVGGLDAGTYFLEETVAPEGYNLMETPVQIDIIPTYSSDGKTVTLSYKVDSVTQSSNTVGIRNSAGATLPITGGMGTTLFYTVGGILVAAALILLVTKKRMSYEA